MGKKIDGFVLTLALAGALYLYFRGAFQSRALSLALALLCCMVLSRLLRRLGSLLSRCRWAQRRRIRRRAGSVAMGLACLPREEALQKLETLLRQSYDGDYEIELIQAPPSDALSQRELFDAWKARRGAQQLAVCATCSCDPNCRMMASTLRKPRVALVDDQLLTQLAAAHPGVLELPREAPRGSGRLRRAAALLINRKNAPRCFVFSAAMLLMYILSANIFNLIFSMGLLFLALASLHRAAQPAKLF